MGARIFCQWGLAEFHLIEPEEETVDSQREVVVVPLAPLEAEPSTEVMLRMLLDREALAIERVPQATRSISTGLVAHGAGAFAKAIGQAVNQFGRSAGSTEVLYRAVLPTGAVARELVPAIGGGYRGLVRGIGTTKIAGQARFLPVVAGGGATLAAGPLIATVGLALAGEMLAQHQINKKLDVIGQAVEGLHRHIEAEERAVLTTADQEARKVAGYLLDQAKLPRISAASHAFAELTSLANKNIEQLDSWSDTVSEYRDSDRVNGSRLMKELVGRTDHPLPRFERMVAQTYESIALRARVVVLEKVAAEFSNPDRSLSHVEQLLRKELGSLADRQAQLVGVLDDLNAMQIDGSKVPIRMAGRQTIGMRTSFGRLARAIHALPDGIPLLTDTDRAVLDLTSGPDGLAVVTPGPPA